MSVAGRYGPGVWSQEEGLGGGGKVPGGTVTGREVQSRGVWPQVDRQTPVKTLPLRNFVCRR